MQRFTTGDRVGIVPRFAHLYPSGFAVMIEIKLDSLRAMFNEYKVEFADGSTANVFEFQIQSVDRRGKS